MMAAGMRAADKGRKAQEGMAARRRAAVGPSFAQVLCCAVAGEGALCAAQPRTPC